MSLIGKNPFVNEVLTSCSAEQLTSLSALINNLGSPTVIKLKELKNTDKGVKYASVFLDDFTLVHGLWIYTDTKCGLFAFQNGFDEMQAIRIDTVNKNYEYVYQHLSVTEFRSTLDESIETQGGEATPWEKSVKNYISYNELAGDLEFSTNINMAQYTVHSCHEVVTDYISCTYLYDNETEESVSASNLLDGGRVFQHGVSISISETKTLNINISNSIAEEFDSFDKLVSATQDFLRSQPIVLYDGDNDEYHLVILFGFFKDEITQKFNIEYIDENGTKQIIQNADIGDVFDAVTQC